MKNLGIAFCSIRPNQLSEEVCLHREEEYYICIEQLKRVLPDSYDLILVDNTIKSLDDLTNKNLYKLLKSENFILVSENAGEKNKGIGELNMLKHALSRINISQYENITYITARRIFTCPYFFEKTENLKAEALLCNPDFLYLDGRFVESHKSEMYNDMIFSMKSKTMKQYSDFSESRTNYLIQSKKGSEQNLYDFIDINKIKFEWVKWIGLIRNDWEINRKTSETKNFHIN